MPGEAPISPKAIGNYLGLSTKEDARKPLWNALYQMRIEGSLSRNDEGQYYRPAVT